MDMDYSRNQRRNSQAIRMQQEHIDKGKLQIQITSQVTAFPIQNAQVSISYTGVPEILWKSCRQIHPGRQKKSNWRHRPSSTA